MSKKNTIAIGVSLIPLLLCIILSLIYNSCESVIIVYTGVEVYRRLRLLLLVFFIVAILFFIYILLLCYKKSRELPTKTVKQFHVNVLLLSDLTKAKNQFSNWTLSHNDNTWFLINNIRTDIDKVINYYKTLSTQVDVNVYTVLDDVDDILEAVLNSMLKTTRQLLRYYTVMGSNNHNDFRREVEQCQDKIHKLYLHAEDYVESILKYMNDTDTESDDATLIYIKNFKSIILDQVDLANKYVADDF